MIYFIRSEEGPIKIGYAQDPDKRISELQVAHPHSLDFELVVNGDQDLERKIHRRFDAIRMSGEWFEPAPDLLDFIARLRAEWFNRMDDFERAVMERWGYR